MIFFNKNDILEVNKGNSVNEEVVYSGQNNRKKVQVPH